MKLHHLVPTGRRAVALGVALAVVPTTIALAAGPKSASPAKAPASAPAASANLYPFSDVCNVKSPTSTFAPDSSGGGTWTVAPKITCKNPKLRMVIGAILRRNGQAWFSSSGRCVIGLEIKVCHTAAGPVRRVHVASSRVHATWVTFLVYELQGPDAFFWAQRHPGACKFETESLSAVCGYLVDKRTL